MVSYGHGANLSVLVRKLARMVFVLLFVVSSAGFHPAPAAAAAPAQESAPAAPTGLSATAGDGWVLLGWDAHPDLGLTGYNLYRGTESGAYDATPLNGEALILETTYLDSAVSNGTTLFYVVKAVDAAGVESQPSVEISATPQGSEPPLEEELSVQPLAEDEPVTPMAEVCTTVNLAATEDTYMNGGNTSGNYGGSTTLDVTRATNATSRRGTLLRWDLTSYNIPTNATIDTSVTPNISLYVTDTSSLALPLYNLRRAWTEGTRTAGQTGTGASWNYYGAGSGSWTTGGAASTTGDRYTDNLWNATTISFTTLNSTATVNLNTNGRDVIQGWITTPATNYGVTIQDYTSDTTNNLIFSSGEATTVANRPTLTFRYCVPPTITTTGTLSAFSSSVPAPSAEQSYTVSAINLDDALLITAPTDFELSLTSGGPYTPTLTLPHTGGTIASTPVYVRMNRATAGTPSGNITHTSAGAATVNVAVSGTATQYYTLTVNATGGSVALSPAGGSYAAGTVVTLTPTANTDYMFANWSGDLTGSANPGSITMDANKTVTANFVAAYCVTNAALPATEDTYMSAADVLRNNGGNTEIHVDNTTGTARRGALLRWDLSSISTNAAVSAASVRVTVNDASPQVFNLYNMRRSWVEGTSTQADSNTSANWNTFDGVTSWGTVGAASTTLDRYDTNLWGAGTTTFSTTGVKTVALNAAGVAAVQGWASAPASNFGVTMQNYTGSTTNAVYFYSSEYATTADRPQLLVNYCVPITGPTILVTSALTSFSTAPGVPSAAQSYTARGFNLSENLLISAPTGFELALASGGPYSATLSLTPSGGTLASTTIYARLNSASRGTFSGNITHTSAGASAVDVAVTGEVASTLTFQEGVGGYSGSLDTTIKSQTATTSYGTQAYFEWDTEENGAGTPEIALLQFPNLIGDGASQIPQLAQITSATLEYRVYSNTNSYGNTGSLYESLESWDETTTYNDFGGDAGVQTDEYNNILVGSANAGTINTNYTVDVTASVQRWANGTTNNGWVILGDGTDGVEVHSSETATATERPKLTVKYNPITTPYILTSGALAAFSAVPGTPSAAQTYTVRGLNLTDNLVIVPPAGFELSTDNSTFQSALELYPTGGVVPLTTIYVRLNSAGEGSFSGNIVHTSTGAPAVNVAVSGAVLYQYTLTVNTTGSGTVTLSPAGGLYSNGTVVTLLPAAGSGYVFYNWNGANGADVVNTGGVYTLVVNENKTVTANFVAADCTTTALTATADTYLSANGVLQNNGANQSIHVDNGTGTTRRGALLRWDLSGIASNRTVSAVTLQVTVSDVSPLVFNLYNMRRSWVEGTGTSGDSTTSANWNTYDGVNSWGAVGAASTTLDRYDTNLWGANTTTFNTTGTKTVTLNAAGVAAVQGWVSAPAGNYGLTIQNYTGATNDALYFRSEDYTTAAERPILNVTHCVATTAPMINTSSSLSAFTSNINVYSAEQSYTVSGSNLTNNLVITPPANFEISLTSGSGFGSPITLVPSSGSIPATPIYVRFRRATAGTSSGSITHVSSGATQVNIAVSGTAANGAPGMTLVSPTDNATGVTPPPTLAVTVTDPDSDVSDVSFYGRPVGEASGEEFMFVLIPDPQNESQFSPSTFTGQTNWIVANKTTNNIVFVTSTGDMVNTATDSAQYTNADAAIDILDAGGVWNTMAPGNHDMGTGSLYPNWFGPTRYADREVADGYWFGGSYDNYNTYSLFSAGGMDFILINLQYAPTAAIRNWADALLKANPNRRGIVEQHNILTPTNAWDGTDAGATYTALKDNPNLFMILCGHNHTASDGAAYRAELGDDGHTIHIVMADYQEISNTNGYLRLFRFVPAEDLIYMTTYSPTLGYRTTTTEDAMNLAYDMASSGPYTLIGTAADVTSGGTASVSWSGLADNTEYEWYAVANDGTVDGTSATWSFTTGTSATNQPPVITEGTTTSVTMSEDGSPTAFSLTLHATDANPGDTLTWSILTIATNGTAGASGTGASQVVTYAPTANYHGTDSFVVQVSDGTATDTITVNVTIESVNDVPVITAQAALSTPEETGLTLTLANLTVSDPDDTYPADFTMTVADGTNYTRSGATITPALNFNGALTVPVTVNDGEASSNTFNLNVTVTAVNDAPVITAQAALSTPEETGLTLTLANLTVSDPDDTYPADFTMTVADGTNYTRSGATITPALNFNGTLSVPVTVNDGTVDSNTFNLSVTVTAVNDAPVITAQSTLTTPEDTALTILLTNLTVTDPDDSYPAGFTMTVADGTNYTRSGATITPALNFNGTLTVPVTVNDGEASSNTFDLSVTVTAVNDAPVITAQDVLTTPEETALTLTLDDLTVTDPDDTYPTGFTLTVGDGSNYTRSGATITPVVNFNGTLTVPVTVNDGEVDSNTFDLNVTVTAVNDTPVADAQSVSVVEDTPTAITLTGFDVETGALIYAVADEPDHGDLTGTAPNLTYTPDLNYTGPDSFTFTVSDGVLTSPEATVTITVTAAANQPPVITEGTTTSVTMSEDGSPTAFSLTLHATDANPGDTLTWSILTIATNGTAGASGTGASQVVTYAPTANYHGTDSFVVQVSDGTATDTITVNVTIESVNDAPILAAIGDQAVNELALLTFTAAATDDDPAPAFSLEGAPAGAAINASTGVFTWTPTEAQGPVAATFTVKVCDSNAVVLCDQETITVTVSEVNVAPVLAAIGNQSVSELALLTFTAAAADTDLPANTLIYSLSGAPTGAAINASTGVFTWTPTETQGPGDYPFDVCASDGALTDCETITVTVGEVNTAPTLAAIGDKAVNELATLTFTAAATDTDLPANTLTYNLTGAPAGTSIGSSSGVFTWTPTETQGPGTYPFDVCASDGTLTDCETITVTVGEVNTAPDLAAIGNQAANELALLTFTATAIDTDLPANTLTYNLTDAPAGASIGSSSGVFTWTPTETQGPGTYPFDVCAGDGTLSDCETITVTVSEVNVAPVLAAIGNRIVVEEQTLTFTASATDTDLPANTLTYNLTGAPMGAGIHPTTGVFTWTPTAAQGPDAYTFDVCASDGTLTDCETITVTVTEALAQHSIALAAGWNLVSFNLHPVSTAIADVLSTVTGNYDLVYAWDASGASSASGHWLRHDLLPITTDTLLTLDGTRGFWIHMTGADTLSVTGSYPTTTPMALLDNTGGWNLVGYPSAQDGALPAILADNGVGTNFSMVYAYHAADSADPWKLFDRTGAPFGNDLTALSAGWGYWVKVSTDATWSVTYVAE